MKTAVRRGIGSKHRRVNESTFQMQEDGRQIHRLSYLDRSYVNYEHVFTVHNSGCQNLDTREAGRNKQRRFLRIPLSTQSTSIPSQMKKRGQGTNSKANCSHYGLEPGVCLDSEEIIEESSLLSSR